MCMNCLGKGHFVPDCKSANRCRKCQKPHHTQLHVDHMDSRADQSHQPMAIVSETGVSANMAAKKLESCSLLMTFQVQILASDGSSVKTRALLDSRSSASFILERLVQSLRLNRTKQRVSVSGIGGISLPQPILSVTMQFQNCPHRHLSQCYKHNSLSCSMCHIRLACISCSD